MSKIPNEVSSLLNLNIVEDKKKVAMIKILDCHPHFDMKPLFEWDLKTLPFVVGWFERAESYCHDFEVQIGKRKLSSIYQFIRGMPMMYVKAHSSSEIDKARAYKMELQRRQLMLQGELLDLSSEIKEVEELEARNAMRL